MVKTALRGLCAASFIAGLLPGTAFAQQGRLPDRTAEVGEIEEIVVIGEASQVRLMDPFAGGQVARGQRTGLLGNLDFLNSPFSGTAFTEKLIREQQAQSVGDILRNDAVTRVSKGFGNFQEVYIVRGFPVFSDDVTLNGVFGILPRQFVAAEFLERVEIFRGANAFVNGAAPGGSGVGGTINLVPKRAPDDGVQRVTLGYQNDAQFYAAADVGARFGPQQRWGVRLNAVYRDGETAIEDQDRELAAVSVNADYAGERLRFSADFGFQDRRLDDPRPQVTPLGEVPDEPDVDRNYAQPGTFTDEEQVFGVFRAEYDIADQVSAWVAGGGRLGDEANVLANPTAAPDGSTTAFRFDNTREARILSADAGVRTEFQTGPVGHRIVVSGSVIDLRSRNAFALSDFGNPIVSSIFEPTPAETLPPADFFTGGALDDPLTTEEVTNKSAAFADTLSLFDDRLLVTGGFRYQALLTRAFDFNSGARTSRIQNDAITPAAGVVYKLTPDISLYGNYAESLQPGEVAPASSGGVAIVNAGEVLDAFRGEQFEFGGKLDAGKIGATIAFFSLDVQNAIVEEQVFRASGEQRSRGIELSAFGEPLSGLSVVGGLTYLDAALRDTQGGINEGNRPIGIPEIQANVSADWQVPQLPGVSLNGRVVFTGEQYVNEANTVDLSAWTRLDLGVRYETTVLDRDITIRGRVENVANASYWASTGGFPGANYLIQGQPRTFLLYTSVNF